MGANGKGQLVDSIENVRESGDIQEEYVPQSPPNDTFVFLV